MEKFCVFCGERPVTKNLEHVAPLWLIKETGNTKRKVHIGIDFRTKKVREFSFDQLKFPACLDCNSVFSNLEKEAKSVIKDILNEDSVSAKSFDILLSWFDKIRIGIWLGFYYLDKNIYGIIPHFHIEKRINAKDRMLLIYKTYDSQKGLKFLKANTPFFGHYPSCFGLVINQFYFINLSSDFLFSRRLGLPFPAIKKAMKNGRLYIKIREGLERKLIPLLRISYDKLCTEIYQPIIPKEIEDWRNLAIYNTPYVKKYFKASSIGKVLIKKSEKEIEEYTRKKSLIWIPNKVYSRKELDYITAKTILGLQNYLLDNLPQINNLDEEHKQRHKNAYKQLKQYNKYLLRRVEKELKV